VRSHSDELDRVKFVLNLDSLFDSTAEGIAVMWSPSTRDYIVEALQEHHPEVDVRNLFCMSSDYLPYMLKGIPAARPADWRSSFPLWSHTVDDTEDKVPVAWLKANALVCAHLLLKMLTDRSPIGDVPQTLPATRKTKAEVRALVEQEGAADALFKWYSITL
jgi:hypothetical protein